MFSQGAGNGRVISLPLLCVGGARGGVAFPDETGRRGEQLKKGRASFF